MKRLKVKQVDAFTERPFCGNPAAVVLDAAGLTVEEMQAIAREMNLSETAFVFPSEVGHFKLRFFTPWKEVPLAGHPTIATVHALLEEGRISLRGGGATVEVEFPVGVLPIDIRNEGGMSYIWMTQKRPEFLRTLESRHVAEALGISPEELDLTAPPQVVSTGTPQLMVLVRSLRVLERLRPRGDFIVHLGEEADFFSVHVFCLEAYGNAHVHARHFAPGAGVPEDPVTGSASGAMGAYLVRYGFLSGHLFIAEQGHIMGRPGTVQVEIVRRGKEIITVRVGGTAVTTLEGELFIP
jgi:trans-2,3-dihydro-3-hydroxyanthranilate isomerase